MIDRIKAKMSTGSDILNMVIADNCDAADRLIKACSPKDMYGNPMMKNKFPALRPGAIVSPPSCRS